jgi:hypothetical protein
MSNVANATELANGANAPETPAATEAMGVSLDAIRVQVDQDQIHRHLDGVVRDTWWSIRSRRFWRSLPSWPLGLRSSIGSICCLRRFDDFVGLSPPNDHSIRSASRSGSMTPF